MALYIHTIDAVRQAIEKVSPGTKPRDYNDGRDLPKGGHVPLDYLLWMADEVEKMTDVTKAARWIGWVLAKLEDHDFWDLECSRNASRLDKEAGTDRNVQEYWLIFSRKIPTKTIDRIAQTVITLFGVVGVFLVSMDNRWGFVAGLATQPFWLATSAIHKQWGIFFISIIYALSWTIGIYQHF